MGRRLMGRLVWVWFSRRAKIWEDCVDATKRDSAVRWPKWGGWVDTMDFRYPRT